MTIRKVYNWLRSIIVLTLGLFTFIFSFGCIQEFRLFFIPCFFATMAINLCQIFAVKFAPRKVEKIIAISFLVLFVLSFPFLYIATGFALFNWSEDANHWDITRMWVSVIFTDYCVIWLVIRCVRLLLRCHSSIVKESTPLVKDATSTL